MNLACDLLTKLDSAGFTVKDVCIAAGSSPSTIAVLRRKNSGCSQKTYDQMIGALIEMVHKRNQAMIDSGLMLPALRPSSESAASIKRNEERAAEHTEEEQGSPE